DAGRSGGGLCGAQGALDEGMLMLGGSAAPVRLEPGTSRNGAGGYIHSVAHVDGEPAVSIHAYSPPLMVVGQDSQDADGRLVRTPEDRPQEAADRPNAGDSVQLTGAS